MSASSTRRRWVGYGLLAALFACGGQVPASEDGSPDARGGDRDAAEGSVDAQADRAVRDEGGGHVGQDASLDRGSDAPGGHDSAPDRVGDEGPPDHAERDANGCTDAGCNPASCTDGVIDDGETDVDCGGGTCAPCALGEQCDAASDCESSVCDGLTQRCVLATCNDQVRDGSETDVDCGGGACAACGDGKSCLVSGDCASNACDGLAQVCVAIACDDHRTDGLETDVDCGGGTCPACANGKACLGASDCASRLCSSGACAAPSCSDGQENGAETGVDCGGGACAGCALGQPCVLNRDCGANACDQATHACVTPTCTDGVLDGSETGPDCGGGVCAPCDGSDGCKVNADCVSNLCDKAPGSCLPASCGDGVKDSVETGVDCGGGICAGCPLGGGCELDSDCASESCDALTATCIVDACADHRQDGNETDADCGGPDLCARCGPGQVCIVASDCLPGHACELGIPHVCD